MTEKTEAPKESTDIEAETAAPETENAKKTGKTTNSGKTNNAVWMGTAVGVGSAALVAALMYAKRRK